MSRFRLIMWGSAIANLGNAGWLAWRGEAPDVGYLVSLGIFDLCIVGGCFAFEMIWPHSESGDA